MRPRPGVPGLAPSGLAPVGQGGLHADLWACVEAGRWPHGCQISERCFKLAAQRLGTALSDTVACCRSGSGTLGAGVRLPQLLPTPS